jgi:phosphoglucosamine mutase
MCEMVRHHDAHLGIAFDGDADRLVLCDEHGEVVDGDAVMALCATRMIKENRLAKQTLVTTVMSNIGLERAMRDAGGQVVRTQVGDRYVVEEMRRNGYNIGGEQSGHLIFLDQSTTGDGTLAALQLLAVMCRQQKPVSELASIFEPVPQTLVNVVVAQKRELGELPTVMKAIQDVEKKLGKEGRVLVRFSGTEPKARVLIEGIDATRNEQYAREIAEALSKALNR